MMSKIWKDHDGRFRHRRSTIDTTVSILSRALTEQRITQRPVPVTNPKPYQPYSYNLDEIIDCDEVYPNIIIGDACTARNRKFLKRIGITHVLNAAEGTRFGYVPTSTTFYNRVGMKYLGFELADLPNADISKHFYTAAIFMDNCLNTGGKVFVHCMMGVSRSATLVVAYLMIKRHLLAEEAIRLLRKSRDIRPNDGFLYQLAKLDNQLRRSRL